MSTPSVVGSEQQQDRNQVAYGMRREWKFSLTFAHQAARIILHLSPYWESTFIDPRELEQLNRLDRDVKHCPMRPALRYNDLGTTPTRMEEVWTENLKKVTILYSHIPPDTTLVGYCVRSVQHVLSDPQVVDVDGCTDFSRLQVGNKLRCRHKLGGRRSFHFRYTTSSKTKTKSTVYVIGTIINQRGYLCTVESTGGEDLDSYVKKHFLPHYTDKDKFMIDQDLVYSDVSSTILKEQQELFGELRYSDTDAAVAFTIPMHPMSIRPDYSPTQTVGVGSIACMTLELNVYQRPVESDEIDIAGVINFKVNQALLFLDVEDMVRMGYPRIMSTEQYSNMKINRLLDIFSDAKVVGTPGTSYLGVRTGRSRTLTFTYEPFNAVVKVMMTSAIVCGLGVTAVFITKLGGGIFDAHLYLYQQLLRGIKFMESDIPRGCLSRFNSTCVRLVEQNITRCYAAAPADGRHTMEQHLKLLRESCDTRVEGGISVNVPVKEGGLGKLPGEGQRCSSASDGNIRTATPTEELASEQEKVSCHEGDATEDTPTSPVGSSTGGSHSSFHSTLSISVTGIRTKQEVVGGDGTPTYGRPHPQRASILASATPDVTDLNVEPPASPTVTVLLPSPQPPTSAAAIPSPAQAVAAASGSPRTSSEQVSGGADMSRQLSVAVPPSSSVESNVRVPSPARSPADGVEANVAGSPSSVVFPQMPKDELEEDQDSKVQAVLKADDADAYFGLSMYDAYVHSCDMLKCKPNSYLLKKFPTNPRFSNLIHEVDISSNYLGHGGFVAVLNILPNFPNVHTLHFNDMSLDNEDVEHLCEVLKDNKSVREVHLRDNDKITLPSTRFFSRLLKVNPNIVTLSLEGTRLGPSVIGRLQEDVKKNAEKKGDAEAASVSDSK